MRRIVHEGRRIRLSPSAVSGALLFGFLLSAGWASPGWTGTTCAPPALQPATLAKASQLGTQVFATLERSDAQVVLLGRVGADLSKYGLRFSHLGFVLRDAPPGRWTVMHLLNDCGTATSSLYDEGLINFFLDDPFAYEAVIATPKPDVQQALARALRSPLVWRLHQPRYNTIAHPQSQSFQNSNQWLLELLVAASAPETVSDRRAAQQHPLMQVYQPDVISIDRLTRIGGGLFKANVTFTDHPLADRLKGQYALVTVRSVLRFLHRAGMLERLQIVDLQGTSSPIVDVEREHW
jgi:hypothetical protein